MLVPLVVYTILALVAPQIFPNVKVRTGFAALMVAVVFGVLNLAIGWLVTTLVAVISLPAIILTGGIFKILIPTLANGVLLKMTDGILKDFEIKGWLPAFGMGLLFAFGGVAVRILG
jgi:putative membrane protein